ncbi:hypothetical protein M406DRAFT_73354 [Cryphonectria parasitica EP155]|uniref:Glycosyl hydrolase family 43 protein n=1 Tax=Cryphonectria parasitica (strain ATCC 38755 / EP155) TaxID=660469 RepID=A0A9P5CKL4_CRYP1|nr:uncharacterized protein M406DRAFT_73354 [Cryphonectria parasitica EP155]KAF3760895.1 hypothetical protein M406DRAFT_73354 [Cryphonectria parasitica EP155]
MAQRLLTVLLGAFVFAFMTITVEAKASGEITFHGANRFLFDVDGNHISSYALKIYYFTTSAGSAETPLLCYSSVDLINWKFEGVLSSGQDTGGRPHVIYNEETQEYVLWSNLGTGYTVATSSAPNASFTVAGEAALDPRFTGLQPADESVVTIGGKAYLIWSVLNFADPRAGSLWPPIFQTMHISPLTDDFVEGVLPLTDPATNETTYVWHATTTPGGPRISFSGHFFQPLRFNEDGSVQDLDCSADAHYTVPFTLGDGAVDTGALTEATDLSPRFANTWTNSKDGTLTSATVNIAAGNQSVDVEIVVFRFSTLMDLVAPSYTFEQLGSATFTSAQIGTSFKAMKVPLNTTVAKGDNLGFYITEAGSSTPGSSSNLVPFCHLEYKAGACNGTSKMPSGQVAFQQGSGQNSFRGLQGNLSPVQARHGKGIKFFSTVV